MKRAFLYYSRTKWRDIAASVVLGLEKHLPQETLCSREVTSGREQEIEGVAIRVNSSIKILPLSSNFEMGFIDFPRIVCGFRLF